MAGLLDALAQRDTATLRSVAMAPYAISAAADGDPVCDFCGATGPLAYYEVNEFGITGPGDSYLSGDRFYACPRCRELVDASDWKGLRNWIGPSSSSMGHRMLLVGFKKHRKGDAVEFEPGTNPETNR
ncbi:hypothetical protein ACFWUQ_19145 [Streptomyces sp. NPDC058662]|uniref:hypothetical protein n=1 Tax=Streptomyces sp. NPDC058662 TaxID=3346583 RepID=UPI003654703A